MLKASLGIQQALPQNTIFSEKELNKNNYMKIMTHEFKTQHLKKNKSKLGTGGGGRVGDGGVVVVVVAAEAAGGGCSCSCARL